MKSDGRKSLVLPSKNEWEGIVSTFKDLLGKQVKDGNEKNIINERLNLRRKNTSALKHKGTKGDSVYQ